MLKTIDVLIGVSVVMLLASLAVTVLTHFVTSLVNSRGRHLLDGITGLLQQIAPGLEREVARRIAAAVLTHPMIRQARDRYGAVIHREELAKILLELAANDGPQKLGAQARQKLLDALRENGISDPGAAIDKARAQLSKLDVSHPELANHIRQSLALLHGASSVFLTKLNAWFDTTMDRTSERFTATTRGITLAMGLIVAFTLQLDTLLLVNRLATDPQLRASMVQQAIQMDQQQHQWDQVPPEERRQIFDGLASANLVTVPSGFAEWQANWRRAGAHPTILGVILSAILLSFGAPFWYNTLKNLLRLRSTLAQKDDKQRAERQVTQETETALASSAAAAGQGEAAGA